VADRPIRFLVEALPNPDDVLALSRPGLAAYLLEILNSDDDRRLHGKAEHPQNFVTAQIERYPTSAKRDGVGHALMGAWDYLEREGHLVKDHRFTVSDGRWCVLTAEGKRMSRHELLRAQTVHPSTAIIETDKEHDLFISYASEDRDFVSMLIGELKEHGLTFWLDQGEILLGDTISKSIDRGLSSAQFGLVILSPNYLEKPWPEYELRGLIDREVNGRTKVILPIAHGVTHDAISKYSPTLGSKRYVDSDDLTVSQIVAEILKVARPGASEDSRASGTGFPTTIASPSVTNSTAFTPGENGVPTDALPQQSHLLSFQPCLAFEFGEPQNSSGRFVLGWNISNVGKGVARHVRYFLPGIGYFRLTQPLPEGGSTQAGDVYEDKTAFIQPIIVYAQIVVEYEDHGGNIYRQYARPTQDAAPSGAFFRYGCEELGKPYLVAKRSVNG